MTEQSVMLEIDVFNLPVFKDADIFPMIPADELAELADDIKENGLNEPVVIAQINGEWMLIDGRNRREACRIAEVIPAYRIVEADPDKLKALVWSWNGPRRHLSSSQKAMAYAMMYPKGNQGKRTDLLQNCKKSDDEKIDASAISRARFILKHDLESAKLVRDGHPDYPLSATYDAVKKVVKERAEKAEAKRQELEKLTALRSEYPDLASLVDEGRSYLHEALETAANRARKAQEEAERIAREAAEQERRQREEEEARLAEEERQQREAERLAREDYERRRAGFFEQLYYFINSTSIAANETQIKQLDRYVERKEWEAFSQKYRCQKRETLETLRAFAKNLPVLIQKLEIM